VHSPAYNAGVEHRGTDVTASLHRVAESYARFLRQHLGGNLVSVVLYGSVGRGEARHDSDVDLLVICDDLPEGRFARLRCLDAAERGLDEELAQLRAKGIETRFAVIVRTRREAERTIPLYLDMTEDAQVLYDRDAFFAGVLQGLRARLVALGAERRRRGRTRYWILKRDFTPGEVIEL
jgi:predicted nucleotidyltransferase